MLARTREQGFRVHHLTNLGGLVALTSLDLESPALLLGALLQMADVLANCSADQRQALASRGHKRLDQRVTGKRAWKSWAQAQDLQSINLTASQLEKLIEALGGRVPSEPAPLPLVLSQLLSATCDGAAHLRREEVEIRLLPGFTRRHKATPWWMLLGKRIGRVRRASTRLGTGKIPRRERTARRSIN
jgi:hypothetical protein